MTFALKIPLLILAVASVVTAQDKQPDIDSLKVLIKNIPESNTAIRALLEINQIYYEQNKTDSALVYYISIGSEYKGKEIEAVSICLSVPLLVRRSAYNEVISKCLYVKESFKGARWAEESLYNLGELYMNIYKDKETADKYFNELVTDYPQSGLVNSAKIYLGKE
jgi:TolA-binding protein